MSIETKQAMSQLDQSNTIFLSWFSEFLLSNYVLVVPEFHDNPTFQILERLTSPYIDNLRKFQWLPGYFCVFYFLMIAFDTFIFT